MNLNFFLRTFKNKFLITKGKAKAMPLLALNSFFLQLILKGTKFNFFFNKKNLKYRGQFNKFLQRRFRVKSRIKSLQRLVLIKSALLKIIPSSSNFKIFRILKKMLKIKKFRISWRL